MWLFFHPHSKTKQKYNQQTHCAPPRIRVFDDQIAPRPSRVSRRSKPFVVHAHSNSDCAFLCGQGLNANKTGLSANSTLAPQADACTRTVQASVDKESIVDGDDGVVAHTGHLFGEKCGTDDAVRQRMIPKCFTFERPEAKALVVEKVRLVGWFGVTVRQSTLVYRRRRFKRSSFRFSTLPKAARPSHKTLLWSIVGIIRKHICYLCLHACELAKKGG